MIYAYHCILTGAENGLADLALDVSSLNFRQRSGKQSTLRLVVPGGDLYDDIADRADGQLVASLYGNGSLLAEIARANLTQIVPHYGARSTSVNLEGTKQVTYTPAETPHVIDGLVTYRSPAQTTGLWSYRLAGPQYQVIAGDDVAFGDHTFTVREVLWQFDGKSTTLYLTEAAAELSAGAGDAACMTEVSVGSTTGGTIGAGCFFSGRGEYYHNLYFSVATPQWITVKQPSAPPYFDLHLTAGSGLAGYDENGDFIPAHHLSSGSGFQFYADAQTYNVQVYSAVSGESFSIQVAAGQVLVV